MSVTIEWCRACARHLFVLHCCPDGLQFLLGTRCDGAAPPGVFERIRSATMSFVLKQAKVTGMDFARDTGTRSNPEEGPGNHGFLQCRRAMLNKQRQAHHWQADRQYQAGGRNVEFATQWCRALAASGSSSTLSQSAQTRANLRMVALVVSSSQARISRTLCSAVLSVVSKTRSAFA
jgi:hypothetical protein